MTTHNRVSASKRSLTEITEKIENSIAFEVEEAKYTISDLIYRIMEDSGMSRADLARSMNRSRPFVTKLLSGSNNFEISTLVQVARALGCRLDVDGLFVARVVPVERDQDGPDPWRYKLQPGLRLVRYRGINFIENERENNEIEGEEVITDTDASSRLVA